MALMIPLREILGGVGLEKKYEPDPEGGIENVLKKNENVRYAIWQLEQCPTTHRMHIQGYLEVKNKIGMKGVKEILGDPTAHIERRRGTQGQAVDYCSKTNTKVAGPWEYGKKSEGQGERCDLLALTEGIKNGLTIYDIVEQFPGQFIRYNRGIERMMAIKDERNMDDREIEVAVLWGGTGSGKTRIVMKNRENMYIRGLASYGQTWWDGYRGQESILFDEFYGQVKLSDMLRYLDRYPLQIPIRGGYTYARWKKVFITSNTPPWEWYANAGAPKEVLAAFRRRIKWIYHVEKGKLVEQLVEPVGGTMGGVKSVVEVEGEPVLTETPWTDEQLAGGVSFMGGYRPLNP